MKILYFFPKGDNAPAKLARELYFTITKKNMLNIDITPYPYNDKHLPSLYYLKELWHLREFTCVHITTSPFLAPNKRFLLHMVALLKKVPVVLNYHGDIRIETLNQFKNRDWIEFFKYIPSYLFVSFFLRNANIIIANSYSMKNLIENKYSVKYATVIPNALDDFWFSEIDRKVHLEGTPSIFYHGRLSYEKGVDLLLKGLSKSKKSKAILYIAGTGNQLNYLKNVIKEEAIEHNVRFLGEISKDQVKAYLSSVDIAIYPSRYDSFSLAILEAFAVLNGLVFFSNKAGINDFVDNMDFKLKSFNPTINEIAAIIQNYQFTTEARDLVFIQKQFAKLFRWDCISKKYLQVYKELTETKGY
ncbi:MAG: glycosyltransferase family 4 protein [Methanosarcina sp.]